MSRNICFLYCNVCGDYIPHNPQNITLQNVNNEDKCTTYCQLCHQMIIHNRKKYENKIPRDLSCDCQNNCPINPDVTLVSVKDPITKVLINQQIVPIEGWTDIFANNEAFDRSTGIYTALFPGEYEIDLVLNYQTLVPLNIISSDINIPNATVLGIDNPLQRPKIELYKPCTGDVIVSTTFPIFHDIIIIPPIATDEMPIEVEVNVILERAAIPLHTIVHLDQFEKIGLRYNSSGSQFVLPPEATKLINFSPDGDTSTLSIKRIHICQ